MTDGHRAQVQVTVNSDGTSEVKCIPANRVVYDPLSKTYFTLVIAYMASVRKATPREREKYGCDWIYVNR